MSKITTDRNDPELHITQENGQQAAYLVDGETTEFVRPVRTAYVHRKCGALTTMSRSIAETYARNPSFYSHTFCVACNKHSPVDEFFWDDGSDETVGS
jgi:hypothetical protein